MSVAATIARLSPATLAPGNPDTPDRDTPDRDIERRLYNWGAWTRQSGSRGRCGSAESRYRAPYPTPPGEYWGGVDVLDAEIVEAAMCRLPPLERDLLIAVYSHQTHPRAICRRMRWRWYGETHWRARLRGARIALGLAIMGRSLLRGDLETAMIS